MPRRDQLKSEQEHHKKAFEVYASISGKRSYEQVASALKVSLSTVKLWAKSFRWRQRLEEREATVARQMADRVLEARTEESSQHRKLVRMALIRVAKAINSGQVKVQVADLDRMIRLEAFLAGAEAQALADRELTSQEFLDLFTRHWSRFSPEKQYQTLEMMVGREKIEKLRASGELYGPPRQATDDITALSSTEPEGTPGGKLLSSVQNSVPKLAQN